MKLTLTTNDVINQLCNDHHANWTYESAFALAQWLEEMEEECGEEHELDLVALRCDFAEYESASAACAEYGLTADSEQNAIEALRDQTIVIKISNECDRVIVQSF